MVSYPVSHDVDVNRSVVKYPKTCSVNYKAVVDVSGSNGGRKMLECDGYAAVGGGRYDRRGADITYATKRLAKVSTQANSSHDCSARTRKASYMASSERSVPSNTTRRIGVGKRFKSCGKFTIYRRAKELARTSRHGLPLTNQTDPFVK
jgi:hypothetical protein